MSHYRRDLYALSRTRLTTRFTSMLTGTSRRRLPQWSRYRRHSRRTHRLQGNCSFKLGKGITYLSMVYHLVYEKGMQRPLWPRALRRPLVTNLLVSNHRFSISAHNVIHHELPFHLFPWLCYPWYYPVVGYIVAPRVKLLLLVCYGLDLHSDALCPGFRRYSIIQGIS